MCTQYAWGCIYLYIYGRYSSTSFQEQDWEVVVAWWWRSISEVIQLVHNLFLSPNSSVYILHCVTLSGCSRDFSPRVGGHGRATPNLLRGADRPQPEPAWVILELMTFKWCSLCFLNKAGCSLSCSVSCEDGRWSRPPSARSAGQISKSERKLTLHVGILKWQLVKSSTLPRTCRLEPTGPESKREKNNYMSDCVWSVLSNLNLSFLIDWDWKRSRTWQPGDQSLNQTVLSHVLKYKTVSLCRFFYFEPDPACRTAIR